MAHSEVASLREQIAREYMAAQWGLCGLSSGTSRHDFITARMERMGALQSELHSLVGEQAVRLVAETLQAVPENITRDDFLALLRRERGATEETELLITWIQEMWRTLDELVKHFGPHYVQKITEIPSSSFFPSEKEQRL